MDLFLPVPRRLAWFAQAFALLIVVGCVEKSPYQLTRDEREMLPPKVRSLLEDVETGKAKGATVSTYSPALAHAFQQKGDKFTTYWIPVERISKGDARSAITLVVTNETGRIASCEVTAPPRFQSFAGAHAAEKPDSTNESQREPAIVR